MFSFSLGLVDFIYLLIFRTNGLKTPLNKKGDPIPKSYLGPEGVVTPLTLSMSLTS